MTILCHLLDSDSNSIERRQDSSLFIAIMLSNTNYELSLYNEILVFSFRIEMPTLDADAIYMLTSFIDSEIRGEALALIELLSRQEGYNSVIVAASGVLNAIFKVLDTQVKEFQELCMKILSNLSTILQFIA